MAIQPLRERILVQPEPAETVTEGGIFIPGTALEKPSKGTVVSVGSGRILPTGEILALEVKAGDTIIYAKQAGVEIEDGDTKYLIMREEDIMGVVS